MEDRESCAPATASDQAIARRSEEPGLALSPTGGGGGSVSRLAPPLGIAREGLDRSLAILDQALGECAETSP